MFYDPLTIWSFTIFATLILATILFMSWIASPRENALGFWGASFTLTTVGISAVAARGVIPSFVSIELGNAMLLFAGLLCWAGFRSFDQRPLRLTPLVAVPLGWVILCQLPPFRDDAVARMWLFSLTNCTILVSIGRELFLGRRDGLVMRRLIIGLLVPHCVVVLARPSLLLVNIATVDRGGVLLLDPSLAFYAFEFLAFMMLIAFCMIALVRERRERHFAEAALADDLTGLLNRRGFLRLTGDLAARGGRLTMLALDLDHFKRVNDAHGHAMGDEVLCLFADVLRECLHDTDVVARMGGEEFAVVLDGASLEEARAVAERIRMAYRQLSGARGHGTSGLSVSIGIATGDFQPGAGAGNFVVLQSRADMALYRAKAGGRDRVLTDGADVALAAS